MEHQIETIGRKVLLWTLNVFLTDDALEETLGRILFILIRMSSIPTETRRGVYERLSSYARDLWSREFPKAVPLSVLAWEERWGREFDDGSLSLEDLIFAVDPDMGSKDLFVALARIVPAKEVYVGLWAGIYYRGEAGDVEDLTKLLPRAIQAARLNGARQDTIEMLWRVIHARRVPL